MRYRFLENDSLRIVFMVYIFVTKTNIVLDIKTFEKPSQ